MFIFCMQLDIIFLGLGQACLGMPNLLQNTQASISGEGLGYLVYLLHVVPHLWKLQCYHAVLVGYGPAYPKFSEINCQYLRKVFNDFVDFLPVVIYILLDTHLSYKNMTGIARHRLLTNQIVRYFKLKKLKSYLSFH